MSNLSLPNCSSTPHRFGLTPGIVIRYNASMRNSIEIQLNRLARDRWARRGVRVLLRAAWIGLSIWCIGLGLRLLFDWELPYRWIGAASLACLAIGALLILRRPLNAREVARRLDRRFRLDEQLATALELGAGSENNGVAAYLHEHSRRTLGQVRRFINGRQYLPWPELLALLALALIIGGMLVLLGIVPLNLARGPLPLPPLAGPLDNRPPEEPFAAPPGIQPGPGEALAPGPGDQQVLAAIAEALRDQSVTRPAAEALDRGDPGGAAQQLRELADQAEQISPGARQELAEALRDAAGQVASSDPTTAAQLEQSAAALEQEGSQPAQGLEQLAEALEQLGGDQAGQQAGQPGQSDGQGQGQGDQAEQGQGGGAGQGLAGEQREQAGSRLNVDGVPLELESDGPGDTPTEGNAEGGNAASTNSGFVQGESRPSDGRVQTGEDPLRIPLDLRDVVQDYFTP